MQYKGFTLHPFQEAAIQAVEAGHSVLVSAPTGAGKTVVAEYAIERGLAAGSRVVYTSPVKALTNQKYRDFVGVYGDRIGIMTGDVTINPDAPVVLMTTEILRNTIFEDIERLSGISTVIMDEIHYISDADRGTVWEECIIFAPPQIRFIGLSATISNLEEFRSWIAHVRKEEVVLVETDFRPVPLRHHIFVPGYGPARIGDFHKAVQQAHTRSKPGRRRGRSGGGPIDIVDYLSSEDLLSCLYFCFSRRECEARARHAHRKRLLDGKQREQILRHYDDLRDRYQVAEDGANELRELAARGIMFHHAGMLPVYKEIVERLFTTGLVRLLFTTETFAVGVNMPARSVVFSSLRKYDGVGFSYLSTLGYYQMAGRAGRQGMDREGNVFTIVNPEFDTQKDIKKVVFGKVEPLVSRFNLSYSAILSLYRTLHGDLGKALDLSFASWQAQGSPKRMRILLDARLATLKSEGYLKDQGELSGKGRIAARLNGYEIQIAELFWAGCFESLSPEDCAVIVVAIVHESRRGDYAHRIEDQGLGAIRNRANKRIRAFRKTETRNGLEYPVKNLDFSLAGTVRAWCQGAAFPELANYTSTQDGDVVRSLRMAIQVLRQFADAVRDDRGLADRLRSAVDLLNRDEVDAERQLRLG